MIEQLVQSAIEDGAFPGAVWAYGDNKRTTFGATGRHTYCPESTEMRLDSIFDLASVTKVVATTSAALLLYDSGKISLDQPVCCVLPEFAQNGKEAITFGHLLRHDSGLIAFRPYHQTHYRTESVIEAIMAEPLQMPPGTRTVYSDLNMIVLHLAIEKLAGLGLPDFLNERVFGPLRMRSTGYLPTESETGSFLARSDARHHCVPTEQIEDWRLQLRRRRLGDIVCRARFGDQPTTICGEVHDPTATVLGGIAGHAGLFSTVTDLEVFAREMLSTRSRILPRVAKSLFTKVQSQASSRALGWDTKSTTGSSAGTQFGPRSFGHTGYTGTSIWCDPDAHRFAILLTNRVHPTSENTKIIAFRPVFHDAVWRVLDGTI